MDNTIPITFVRDRVKQFYKITNTEDDSYIDLMILDSIRDFKSYKYVNIETVNIDICDGKAELPCNFKQLIAVLPPCSEGCVPMVYTSYIVEGCNCHSNSKFTIQGNYLVFPPDFTYESVRLVCQIFKTDKDGFPILIKDHLTYYVKYANYHVGLFLNDARYAAFSNYKQARKNIIHNEKADIFELEKYEIQSIIYSVKNPEINFTPTLNILGDGGQC